MTFHTISRALGYDGTGHKLQFSWQECQSTYDKLTDTANPKRLKAALTYEAMSDDDKAQKAKIVFEGLRRAEWVDRMVEVGRATLAKAEKHLRFAELREQERTMRRQRWSEIKPGKYLSGGLLLPLRGPESPLHAQVNGLSSLAFPSKLGSRDNTNSGSCLGAKEDELAHEIAWDALAARKPWHPPK